MSITRTSHLVSAHLWFFPTGAAFTIPSAGTASATARPAHDPAIISPTTAAAIDAGWIDLGTVESLKLVSKANADVKIWGANPGSGVKTIKKILKGMVERTYQAQLYDWTPFNLSLFFRAALLSDAGSTSEISLTPDSQALQEGWLYAEGYDGSIANEMLTRIYSWGAMEISGDGETDTNKNFAFNLTHTQELSTLNTVIVENA
jgi:hypothetical protein